jgi:hypothetical protein
MSEPSDLDLCRHGEMNPALCPVCSAQKPRDRKSVYFTAGGQHYHLDHDCLALAEGQKLVRERGGSPSSLQSGYLDVIKATRKPCKTCARPS